MVKNIHNGGNIMDLEMIVGAIVSFLILIYLIYALFKVDEL